MPGASIFQANLQFQKQVLQKPSVRFKIWAILKWFIILLHYRNVADSMRKQSIAGIVYSKVLKQIGVAPDIASNTACKLEHEVTADICEKLADFMALHDKEIE